MKQVILVSITYFIVSISFAQKNTRQIEINPYVRFDKFPQFSYKLGGRPNTDYVNIKGTSTGINLGYKMPLSQTVYLKPSIGYYKYSFSNILRENTTFGTSNSRNINFISPLLIPFFSDKYYYNCLAINIGLEKLFTLRNDFYSNVGFQLNNYLTFSQNYHLTSNPEGSQNFKKNKKEYFGSSGLFNVNILKKVKDVSFGPSLMFPLFDFWKTDETFQEETNSQTRNKLFKGICIGISVNYSLNKKQSK